MRLQTSFIYLISLILLFISGHSLGSDLAKEKRWADQVVDGIIDGEAIWLEDGKSKFLGIYTENYADKPLGAAIVLHGIGVHPNWPDVIQPLRTELPNYGWATLSLQLPILPNEAEAGEYIPLFPEVSPRLDAGIAYLQKQGHQNIVIVAHSLGSTMSAYALANNPGKPVRALVVVGVSAGQFKDDKVNFTTNLPKLNMPVLDIYGSNDLDNVVSSAKEKARIAKKAGNSDYRQIKVPGANHFFAGVDADLVRHVKSWLSKYGGEKAQTGKVENKAEK
jgi:pimeloyl-ACP methyl ester carboxylesterase